MFVMSVAGRLFGILSLSLAVVSSSVFSNMTTPEVAHASAARSVQGTLHNQTPFKLLLDRGGLSSGVWVRGTPSTITAAGRWVTESDGFMTGTAGWVRYRIVDADNVEQGRLILTWDNPYVGVSTYPYEVTTYGKYAFSMGRSGGGGDNAAVDYYLYEDVQPPDVPFQGPDSPLVN
jgi:hypothetical protein